MVKERKFPLNADAITDAVMSAIDQELAKHDRKFPNLDLSSLTNSVAMVIEKKCRTLGLAPAYHRYHRGNRALIEGVIVTQAIPGGHARRAGNRTIVKGMIEMLVASYEANEGMEKV